MGDDIHDDYFDIGETELLDKGGGGAYQGEESAGEEDEVTTAESKEEKAVAVSVSAGTLKRKEKLKEIKALKRRKKGEAEEAEDENFDQLGIFLKSMPKDKDTGRPVYDGVGKDRFYNTTSFLGSNKAKWKDNAFVMAVASGITSLDLLNKRSEEMGCPYVIVLCASALRASHVLNSMSSLLKCSMAKCWSKHFKVHDQVEALSKKAYPVVVGTPARIAKLFELGALCANKLQILLIDNGKNKKNFTLLSLPDTKNDVYNLLKESLSAPTIKYGVVGSSDVIE